jgi:hypothetical protein
MPYGNFKQHQAINQTIPDNYIPSLLLLLQGFLYKKNLLFSGNERPRTGGFCFPKMLDAITMAAGHTTRPFLPL